MPLTVSVIIPTYNRPAALLQTLEDLREQTRPPDAILVVDQSRDDNGAPLDLAAAVGQFPRVRYIYQEEPNAQKARNRAIAAAKGDILILLDDDVRLGRTFVECHLRNYEQDPTLDGVAGQVLSKNVPPTRELPDSYQWPGNGWMFFPLNFAERRPTINWPSCNASVRRSVALKVGGFDENFVRTHCDDTEFSWRLHQHGARIVFDPDASVVHLLVQSGGRRPQAFNRFVWADTEGWGVLFYFWRKCFGVRVVWRHVWWFVRRLILRKAVVLRPHWFVVNLYYLVSGFRWAGKRLKEGPRYLKCEPGAA
jgi:GT2 family glycosyltransferase